MCFSVTESHFSTEISARPGKIFEIRELHVVVKRVFFLKVLNLQIKSQWAEKTLRVKVKPGEEKRVEFPTKFPYFHLFSCVRLT